MRYRSAVNNLQFSESLIFTVRTSRSVNNPLVYNENFKLYIMRGDPQTQKLSSFSAFFLQSNRKELYSSSMPKTYLLLAEVKY